MDTLEAVLKDQIVAIIRGVDQRHILEVAKALSDGGVSMMEITFDHLNDPELKNTCASIRTVRDGMGGAVHVGAGTVLTPREVQIAKDCGAEYIISPNVCGETIRETKRLGLLSMPGALTPSEIVEAHNCGADIVKVFPAGDLGPGYIRSLRGPLPHIRMAAVGGVGAENIVDFQRAGCCCFGIGGSLVNSRINETLDFEGITRRAMQIRAALEG